MEVCPSCLLIRDGRSFAPSQTSTIFLFFPFNVRMTEGTTHPSPGSQLPGPQVPVASPDRCSHSHPSTPSMGFKDSFTPPAKPPDHHSSYATPLGVSLPSDSPCVGGADSLPGSSCLSVTQATVLSFEGLCSLSRMCHSSGLSQGQNTLSGLSLFKA